jgi:hypothetical protein
MFLKTWFYQNQFNSVTTQDFYHYLEVKLQPKPENPNDKVALGWPIHKEWVEQWLQQKDLPSNLVFTKSALLVKVNIAAENWLKDKDNAALKTTAKDWSFAEWLQFLTVLPAETIAVSDTASPTIGISNFASDMGTNIVPTIYEDNMSTIKMIKNGKPNADHSRHINIRQFFISDIIKRGEIKLKYVKTEDQIADLLTKPLQGLQFLKLRNLLLNYNPNPIIATLRGRANHRVAVESKKTLSLITVTN